MYPKGYVSRLTGKPDPEVYWSENYPHEYFTAMECAECLDADERWILGRLNGLVFKIEAEAAKGQPLQSKRRVWEEGGYPAEFLAARDYLRKQNELLAA